MSRRLRGRRVGHLPLPASTAAPAGVRPTRSARALISLTTPMCIFSLSLYSVRLATRDVVEAHRLVLLEPLAAALAPQSGLLHAAEGSGRVGGQALIDADQAGLEPVGDVEHPIDAFAEHVSGEAELRRVRSRDHLGLGVEALNRRDRSEDLG